MILGFGGFAIYGLIQLLSEQDWFDLLVSLEWLGMTVLGCVVIPLFLIRAELFAPENLPVIFDREDRRIYQLTRYTQPS